MIRQAAWSASTARTRPISSRRRSRNHKPHRQMNFASLRHSGAPCGAPEVNRIKEAIHGYRIFSPAAGKRHLSRRYVCADVGRLFAGVQHYELFQLCPRRRHHGRRLCGLFCSYVAERSVFSGVPAVRLRQWSARGHHRAPGLLAAAQAPRPVALLHHLGDGRVHFP